MSTQAGNADPTAIESENVYVVYDEKGSIRHVHRAITFRGATALSAEEEAAEALDLAGKLGRSSDKLRVLPTKEFDRTIRQRVDVAQGKLVARA